MTTGIPHGPLSSDHLPKLTELSVLLVVLPPHIGLAGRNQPPLGAVIRAQPQSPFVQSVFLPDYEPDFGWHVSRFTYLGERPEPGSPVILAPEGGWNGHPLPGRDVEVILRNGNIFIGSDLSDPGTWKHIWGEADIVGLTLIEDAKPEGVTDPVYTDGAPVPDDMRIFTSTPNRPAQALAGMEGGWTALSPDEQFALATRIAANVGYELTPEPEYPDSPHSPHPDDLAVDRFAAAMKAKLAKKRADGRGGWEDKADCSAELLSRLLRGHVEKGDPLDVGNFAMMLHQRGDRIAPASPPAETGEGLRIGNEALFLKAHDALELARNHFRANSEGVSDDVFNAVSQALYAIRARPVIGLDHPSSDQSDTERMRAAANALANEFAWSAVKADCEDARVHLQGLIDTLRAALAEKEAGQ